MAGLTLSSLTRRKIYTTIRPQLIFTHVSVTKVKYLLYSLGNFSVSTSAPEFSPCDRFKISQKFKKQSGSRYESTINIHRQDCQESRWKINRLYQLPARMYWYEYHLAYKNYAQHKNTNVLQSIRQVGMGRIYRISIRGNASEKSPFATKQL